MKNLLLPLVLLVGSLSTQAQTIFTELNIRGESIGIELMNRKNQGVYFTVGSNLILKSLKLPEITSEVTIDDFYSSVSWYGENGAYLPSLPPELIFTSPEWGNVLIESGYYVSTFEMTTYWKYYHHDWFAVGGIIPVGKDRIRIGVGLWTKIITGEQDYRFMEQRGNVSKYWDSWEVIGNDQNLFVVEYTPRFKDIQVTTPIYDKITRLNINASYVFRLWGDSRDPKDLSIGINANTITVGLHYPL